jgi:hypothetical protein
MTIRNIGRGIANAPSSVPSTPATKAPATKAPATGTPASGAPTTKQPVDGPRILPVGKPIVSRNDSVEISDAARSLAGGAKAAGAGGALTASATARELSPARVQELRQRVLSGAYNSTAVADQVARRILSSGDA